MIRVGIALLLCCGTLPAFAQYAKNTISFPDEPFAVPSTNDAPGWVKFLIMTDEPQTVIFQDSITYPFHYDFAVNELPEFEGMSPTEFDQVTLHAEGQLAVLGAVFLPPLVGYQHVWPEFGIQFVRQDPYDPTDVVAMFNRVKYKVLGGGSPEAFYFPALEQQASAEANAEFFESQGITISSTARWARGNACYSHGWALGELKYFASDQITAAFLNGDLLPQDILLTDGVPAEIPFVAGVITLSPSTPASHVAILAETFDVPFTYLTLAEDAQRAQDLVGHKMVLRVDESGHDPCSVRLIDVEGQLDTATIDEILALKIPPPLAIQPMQTYGAFSASADGLAPGDIVYFGGKAANYGLLRQSIPDNSPVATAFSFDLWNDFLDQTLVGGDTLRETIAQMLAGYGYPPDIQALDATLDDVRDLIKDDALTSFSSAGASAVIATFQDPQYGFDPNAKLRHRSSTNVEDGDRFSGAGLYDSFSGCLADDLDGDDSGPSHCDPDQDNERGVFRAIRKVFASFYNLNAFLERLRHGVVEDDVGMALLVHHSFPDEIELANGVALYEPASYGIDTYLVSQPGSASVTNPEPGEIPEEAHVSTSGTASVLVYSNLLPLGATALEFPQEYQELRNLLLVAAGAWEQATGVVDDYELEFEYKKVAPNGDLVVKQIRRVPWTINTASVTPFLINEPTDYCVFQGEYSNVFANHRLKSRWTVETRNMWLTEENLLERFYENVSLEYQEVCQLYQQTGDPAQWPQSTHGYASGTVTDGWRLPYLQNPRNYQIELDGVPTLVGPSKSPLLTVRDFGCFKLKVDYDEAVPAVDYTDPIMTTTDQVKICSCPEPNVGDQLIHRTFEGSGGVSISTWFYWPHDPEGATAGYTAPLVAWWFTWIEGLTTSPIWLYGDYSQTYRPAHHNFSAYFIFEPALEPGVTQEQLAELAAQGVRVVYVQGTDVLYYDDATWTDACLGCTGFDADQDGYCTSEPAADCDDARPDIWATPGEVPQLEFSGSTTLTWSEPLQPGGQTPLYDTLRSADPADFLSAPVCVEFDDGSDQLATDASAPSPREVLHYLVRAENDCPVGEGSLGQDSAGAERQGGACP